jgi:FtsH-binding integral membrane protein
VSPARDGRRRSRSGQACGAAEAAEAGTLSDHHVVHQLASLAVFLVLVIAMFPLARGLRRNGGPAGVAVATRLVGVVGMLVIAAMTTVGLGDLGGVVQRLFIALLFGAPVALTGWSRIRWAVTGTPVGRSR